MGFKSVRSCVSSSRLNGKLVAANTIVLLLILLCPLRISGYDLCTCNQLSCEIPVNCSHGTLSDQCGCCMVCARGAREVCGDGAGVCGKGLQCVFRNKPGDLVTGKEQGICLEIAPGCDASSCDSIVTHRCPSDSILIHNGTQDNNQCCKTTYECQCNMSVCKVPHCATGHTPQVVRYSKKRPGSCCDLYHCKISGCWSSDDKVYKNTETWKEGDCIICLCVEGKKQCQAEMCVKKCHSPKYVTGRCCPICEYPSLYPNQSSSMCPSLSECNITCETGLQQTPDGCHVCTCKPVDCYKDCRYGYVHDDLGQDTCKCLKYPLECPDLDKCSKHCSNGYQLSKKGCPKCRCNKCSAFNCYENCSHGYQRDRNGCRVCKCQDISISHVNISVEFPNRKSNENHDIMAKNELAEVEKKYIIALSAVGTLLIILLILVFVLLYMRLKQRHQASWTVPGQDSYCKCPLFIGHSPVLQHKYNIDTDMAEKYVYSTVVVQKYNHPSVEMLQSYSPIIEQKCFLPTANIATDGQDFINANDDMNFMSNDI